jgi:hypothetical protein
LCSPDPGTGYSGRPAGKELAALQSLAADLLGLTTKDLNAHVGNGAVKEICHGDETI